MSVRPELMPHDIGFRVGRRSEVIPEKFVWVNINYTPGNLISSLMRATPAKEGVSLWQEGVEIQRIDRLQAP